MRRLIGGVAAVTLFTAACTTGATPSTIPDASTTTGPIVTTTEPEEEQTTTTLSPGVTPPTTLPTDDTILRLEPVAEGFEQPVFYTTMGGDGFVVDQPGIIWIAAEGDDPAVFLDIRERVKFKGEQGLLGLAFHPDHPDRFYVNYTAKNDATIVSEFTIDKDLRSADPNSERVILEVKQPASNHNGGMIAFGPAGDLWIGMGDGGASNDKYGNGQRGDTLLGSMLRIEVGPEIETYQITKNHAFDAPEIWAIGLRNPWRFSFDGENLWIADVGQNDVEEINRESMEDVGLNFGWPLYEGTDCFAGPCDDVDASGRVLSLPVHEYRHDEGCSITGGYVYRGSAIPQLDGHYFFSDWCTGFIRSIALDGSVHDWTDGTGAVAGVSSFGRDDAGEIYVVSARGTVYRIVEEHE
ncbi:MAG: PQQ-dependent sugar dehydrogenase [Actinomycetota bacterium]|nr:PQQ-dependent sugar dehydrogenase [Actinomycetota bacterium]